MGLWRKPPILSSFPGTFCFWTWTYFWQSTLLHNAHDDCNVSFGCDRMWAHSRRSMRTNDFLAMHVHFTFSQNQHIEAPVKIQSSRWAPAFKCDASETSNFHRNGISKLPPPLPFIAFSLNHFDLVPKPMSSTTTETSRCCLLLLSAKQSFSAIIKMWFSHFSDISESSSALDIRSNENFTRIVDCVERTPIVRLYFWQRNKIVYLRLDAISVVVIATVASIGSSRTDHIFFFLDRVLVLHDTVAGSTLPCFA